MKLLMGIDLGTSFIKVGVYDTEGNEVAVAKEAIKSDQPGPGQFIQHGDDLMDAVISCIRNTLKQIGERKEDIAAIGFTGQMAGFMGVDKDWNDVTGWTCSLDTRYIPFAEQQNALYADDFYRYSGTNSPMFSSKYAWFRHDFPKQAEKIAKYVMISGYVIGKMSDLPIDEAVIDGSLITWTGLADVKGRCWSEKICKELGIDMNLLPRITSSFEVVAHLSKKMAELTGLPCGVPLVAGAGDKIAGCTGAGNLSPGGILFEDASFGAISCMSETYVPDLEVRGYDMLNGIKDGDYYAHYYMPGSGITREWFINNFYQKENESLKDAYKRIDEEIEKIAPGSDSLFAIGMLGGTAMPFNGDLKGVFMGHSWSHTPAHFYRSLVESFAFAVKTAMERVNLMYPQYQNRDCIRMIGGGADSDVCAQIYADVFGVTVETLDRDDPALWGCCLLAGKGIGLFDDIHEYARNHVGVRKRYEPDKTKRATYDELQDRYNRYVKTLTPMCQELQKKKEG